MNNKKGPEHVQDHRNQEGKASAKTNTSPDNSNLTQGQQKVQFYCECGGVCNDCVLDFLSILWKIESK